MRTKTIETGWNDEREKYFRIIHFPLSLSSKPLFQADRKRLISVFLWRGSHVNLAEFAGSFDNCAAFPVDKMRNFGGCVVPH